MLQDLFQNVQVEDFYSSTQSGSYYRASLKVCDSGEITFAYYDGHVHKEVQWKGRQMGEGHYRLTCPEINGIGTLHHFPLNGEPLEELEGCWQTRFDRGMWKVVID